MQHIQSLLLAFLCFSVVLRAEPLEWKTKRIELTADAKQEKIEASFAFKNAGAKKATITSVTANCDCIIPGLAKRIFGPGETGEIKVVFKLDGKVGQQEKTISVFTHESPQVPVLLTLHVNVPELVDIHPRLLVWRVGEELAEKVVEIFMATHSNFGLAEIKASEPGFESRLETITPNRKYRLILKPQSTNKPLRSVLAVTAQGVMDDQPSSFNIYAQVR